MVNVIEINNKIDIYELAAGATNLRKIASSGGGEYAGPCPLCGGSDRFRVQPQKMRWLCRNCTDGKWRDGLDLYMRLQGLSFKDAVREIGGELSPVGSIAFSKPSESYKTAYASPADAFQVKASRAIETCEKNLWSGAGENALRWLREVRKLNDEAIKNFRLGYSTGYAEGGLFIPRGVVIPCVVGGVVWYLKIRTSNGKSKYTGVKGNRSNAIFNADEMLMAYDVLVVEGEFDAMTAWQELRDVMVPVTFGAAANRLDLATWGVYLVNVRNFLVTYDNDEAGENGARNLVSMSSRAKIAKLPDGFKDVNEYHQQGGNLWNWIKKYAEQYILEV